jgi:general secretion pathway protein C
MIKRYFWLAHLLLVTLAAVLGADMIKAYLSAKLTRPFAVRPSQSGTTAGQQTRSIPTDYVVISERNIFNANPPKDTPVVEKPPPPPPPGPEVERTQLQLKLIGAVAGTDRQRFAIIEDLSKRGVQTLYQVGDTIQSATITAISRDCVVFNNGGKPEELCFLQDGLDTKSSSGQGASPRAAATPPPAGDSTEIVRVDSATWRVSRELIVDQFANFGNLATQARLMPYMVQGQPQGFRLVQITPASTLQRLGLQTGDILQKVNGQGINSPTEALQAFQQLHNESTVRLELLRQNRPTTLTYEIR